MQLKNHNAIITGASQGLGKVISEHFIKEGANIIICSRNKKDILEAQNDLLQFATKNQKVLALTCDVSSKRQVDKMIKYGMEQFGSLQSLVLNAAIYGPMGPTEEVSLQLWKKALEVNLFGVLLPCRAAIPIFKRSQQGKIIVIAGGGATNPLPNISAYAASKAAVVRLVETLAEELNTWNIDVNAIAPGALATRLIDEVVAAGPKKVGQAFFEKNLSWKKNGATSPHLAAALAVYLATDKSNGITGKLISAQWDNWEVWAQHLKELQTTDLYTLRRITGRERGITWGDK